MRYDWRRWLAPGQSLPLSGVGVLLLLHLGLGCTAPTDGNPPRNPQILLAPEDGVTNPLNQGIALGALLPTDVPAMLDSLAKELSIRTWPELVEVPTTASSEVLSGYLEGTVTLTAAGSLQPRWYVVRLAAVPPGLAYDPAGIPFLDRPGPSLSDGSFATRFFAGSAPNLRGLVFRGPKRGNLQIDIVFSEPVSFAGDLSKVLAVTQSGTQLVCTVPFMPSTGSPKWSAACLGGDPSIAIDIGVPSGFVSSSGVQASGMPFRVTLTPTSLEKDAGADWYYPIFSPSGPPP